MNAKTFLTINAIVALVYGVAFVLIPAQLGVIYGVPADVHTELDAQFFGSALITIGVLLWFAKDFNDPDAVRGILIATAVGDVVGGGVNLVGTFGGLLNGMAWSSTLVYVLLLVGSLYFLFVGSRKST
jgi:hypothetical protein